MSERCKVMLAGPPECMDFRKLRSWTMCKAWSVMDVKKVPFKEAIREAWREAKAKCYG